VDHNGYPMTGRDPRILADLIEQYGDEVWTGGEPLGGRGDRNDPDHRPLNRQRKEDTRL